MPKYLFNFEKSESVRWLGHLDILRAFERAMRRADLPVAFTQGFNPRIRINFASALSTGITGSAEPAIVELTELLPTAIVEERLNTALPPGIRVNGFEEVPDSGSRDLLNGYDRAEYLFICACSDPELVTPERAVQVTEELMAQSEIPVVREREGRSKTVDIRPFISLLEFVSRDPETRRGTWRTIVGIGEWGNVRPVELVPALAAYLPGLTLRRAHRVRLHKSQTAQNHTSTAPDQDE